MFHTILSALLSIFSLIFSPLEAATVMSSNHFVDASTDGALSGSDSLSSTSSGAVARLVVSDTASAPEDFASFDADYGAWVASDDNFGRFTITFRPNYDEDFDDNGLPVAGEVLASDPVMDVVAGCKSFEAVAMLNNSRLEHGGLHTLGQECSDYTEFAGQYRREETRARALLNSKPRVYVDGDTMWLASNTQVVWFVRVVEPGEERE